MDAGCANGNLTPRCPCRERCSHKPNKQRVRLIRPGLEFRVELHAYIERMIRKLHNFHKVTLRIAAGKHHSRALECCSECIVELIAMAVPLAHQRLPVKPGCERVRRKGAIVTAQAQRAPDLHGAAFCIHILALVLHQIDHRILRFRIDLRGVGVRIPEHVAGIFHNGHLHAEADAQKRNPVFPRVTRRSDLAFKPPRAKAARDKDAIRRSKQRSGILCLHIFRLHHCNLHPGIVCDPRMF